MKLLLASIVLLSGSVMQGCSTTSVVTPSGYSVKRSNLFINPELSLHAKTSDGTEIDLGYKQTNSDALVKALDLTNSLARAIK